MSLTMKADGTYEAPWFVVPEDLNVDAQRQYIIDAFGLTAEQSEGKNLVEVFFTALPIWRTWAAIANSPLAGEPVGSEPAAEAKPAGKPKRGSKAKATQTPTEDPAEAPAAPTEPSDPFQGLLDEIAGAETKLDCRRIFKANQEAFTTEARLSAALEARTRELSA